MNDYPLHPFRFQVEFQADPLRNSGKTNPINMSAAFSECTGLEATMEPKVIKAGGRNYGAAQRAGPVTFATVILKRGITTNADLWTWFDLVNRQANYGERRAVTITLFKPDGGVALKWRLERALPIKFKAADFNAKADQVGVEELHLAHEGLSLIEGARGNG